MLVMRTIPKDKRLTEQKSGLEQAGLPPRILKTRSVPLCLTPKECPSIWKSDQRERERERVAPRALQT